MDSTAFLRNSPVSSRFLTNSAKQIFSDCEKSCDRSYTDNCFCCRQMFHNHCLDIANNRISMTVSDVWVQSIFTNSIPIASVIALSR